MSKQTMIRRCFGTIHMGHLGPAWDDLVDQGRAINDMGESVMRMYFEFLTKVDWTRKGYTGVQIALETGEQHGRVHIQFYAEHGQKRFRTLANDWDAMPTCFDIVRDSKGAYEYCSGTGRYEGKFALARYTHGTFKLHGDTQKADLKYMIELILGGSSPRELFREHPYAWCVHRDRLLKFYEDKQRYRELTPRGAEPAVTGFDGQGILPAPPDTDTPA